jgi:ribosomal protein S18 acetylase RimI-like enzyme
MDLKIRTADSHDAEVVALLARITFTETFGNLFEEHKDDLSAYLDRTFAVTKIRHSLATPINRYWLAFANELPVGYAKLKFPSPSPHLYLAKPAQLQKIYVLREFIGCGLGKPLLAAVLDHARKRNAKAIWLDVLKQNARAIHFYQREGFTAMGNDTYTIGAQSFDFDLMVFRVADGGK